MISKEASENIRSWKASGAKIVFTNGCFDLLHAGHVAYLEEAKALGDKLILGLNSDASVKRLKGSDRPIISEEDRKAVMEALQSVDLVILFEEDTPLLLIQAIMPDILVKGGDYKIDQIVGQKEVEKAGGEVLSLQFKKNRSTSSIIERIKKLS